MISSSTDRCINIAHFEAPLEKVWWSVATASGSNTYLTYYSSTTGHADEPKVGDQYTLNYGDIMNETRVVECKAPYRIVFSDQYESMDPDGNVARYEVQTSYDLKQVGHFIRLTLEVRGFSPTTTSQWLRECLEMGWRRSLINLKSVLELGLDLRIELFSYPRLGVANCTLTKELGETSGLTTEKGNYLLKVYPNSPVDRAGLVSGDVIISIGGEATPSYASFVRVISSYYGKNEAPLVEYIRNGVTYSTTVNLANDDVFTGIIDIEKTTWDEVRSKREELAKQRSSSGSLWQQKD